MSSPAGGSSPGGGDGGPWARLVVGGSCLGRIGGDLITSGPEKSVTGTCLPSFGILLTMIGTESEGDLTVGCVAFCGTEGVFVAVAVIAVGIGVSTSGGGLGLPVSSSGGVAAR